VCSKEKDKTMDPSTSAQQSQSQQRPARVPIKQASGAQRGERAQARARQRTTQIRKAKKSQLVSLKRRCGPRQEQIMSQQQQQQQQQQSSTQQQANMNSQVVGSAESSSQGGVTQTKVAHLARLASEYVATSGEDTEKSAMLLHQLQEALSSGDGDMGTLSACADTLLRPKSVMLGGDDQQMKRYEAELAQLEQAGTQLANKLADSLTGPHKSIEERLDASRILTNLAAGESSSSHSASASSATPSAEDDGEDVGDIYGGGVNARGWCSILTTRSHALAALIQVVTEFATTFRTIAMPNAYSAPSSTAPFLDATAVVLCEQCCWALGNIAGDSQRSRSALVQFDGIRPLVCALRISLTSATMSSGPTTTAGLCRNAIWALCNLLRGGDVNSSALIFLEMDSSSNHAEATTRVMGPLLTPLDVSQLLAAPELIKNVTRVGPTLLTEGEISTAVSWDEIALEACWLLSFLTAREDQAVPFLCGGGENDGVASHTLFDALEVRTLKAISDLSKTSASITSDNNDQHAASSPAAAAQVCIPCIRIIGNIATACHGAFGAHLVQHSLEKKEKIKQSSSSSSAVSETLLPYPSLMDGLAALLRHGASPSALSYNDFYNYGTGGEISVIATETAWSVGSLLCDFGQPLPHPATAIAPILVPALSDVLLSPNSSFPLKREAVSALLNAACPPPVLQHPYNDDPQQQQQQQDMASRPIRRELVQNLVEAVGFIPCLVQLLRSTDMEVVLASVRLVDQIYRLLLPTSSSEGGAMSATPLQRHIKRLFDECRLEDQLELVCDRASGMYSASRCSVSVSASNKASGSTASSYLEQNTNLASLAADVAADLVDDYYGEDDDYLLANDHSDTVAASLAPATTSSGAFAFGVASATSNSSSASTGAGFDFSGGGAVPNAITENNASATTGMGRGRGRGRGRNIPSWMKDS
jgi:hypothetical protein